MNERVQIGDEILEVEESKHYSFKEGDKALWSNEGKEFTLVELKHDVEADSPNELCTVQGSKDFRPFGAYVSELTLVPKDATKEQIEALRSILRSK